MIEEPIYNDAAQLERTVLSWNRTSLAVAANGALLIHAGVGRSSLAFTCAGLAIVVAALVLWAVTTSHYPSARRMAATYVLTRGRDVVCAAALVTTAVSSISLVQVST